MPGAEPTMAQATGMLTVRHRVDLAIPKRTAISPPAAGAAWPEKPILPQPVAKLPWSWLGIIRRGNRPPPPHTQTAQKVLRQIIQE